MFVKEERRMKTVSNTVRLDFNGKTEKRKGRQKSMNQDCEHRNMDVYSTFTVHCSCSVESFQSDDTPDVIVALYRAMPCNRDADWPNFIETKIVSGQMI